jgi:hypothetical protein
MTGPRKGYTKKKDRIKLYMEKINALRIAEICMDTQKLIDIAQEIVALNRRFEREDNPHGN